MLGMELCQCSLHQLITDQKLRPTSKQQARISRELCEGVAFLHNHSIIHRDLRPKNILMKTGGFDGTVKITDFGLSKDINTTDADVPFSTTTVQSETEIASFGFYPPEMYRRGRPTSKVDVFSLGCCIFCWLTVGRRPHEDSREPTNKFILSANIQNGNSNLRPLIKRPEAADLVVRMIATNPAKRPTMQWLLQWHPCLWPSKKRFEFLCAVANEDGLATCQATGKPVLHHEALLDRVLGEQQRAGSKPKEDGWRARVDDAVWEQYTTDSRYRHVYVTSRLTHLLRFLRNACQHQPPAGSSASAVFAAAGGVGCYFLARFPRLLMAVWVAMLKTSWGKRDNFRVLLPIGSATDIAESKVVANRGFEACVEKVQPPFRRAPRAPWCTAPAPPSVPVLAPPVAPASHIEVSTHVNARDWSKQQVATRVSGICTAFMEQKYGDAFIANRIDGGLLFGEQRPEERDLEYMGIKIQLHRKRILQSIGELRGARETKLPVRIPLERKYTNIQTGTQHPHR
jgi:hypothetical protein